MHEEGSDLIAYDIEPGVFYEKDGLKITAFNVEHMLIDMNTGDLLGMKGSTLGFRIDYNGRSVVFSGDTRSTEFSNIIEHAIDANDPAWHAMRDQSREDGPIVTGVVNQFLDPTSFSPAQ